MEEGARTEDNDRTMTFTNAMKLTMPIKERKCSFAGGELKMGEDTQTQSRLSRRRFVSSVSIIRKVDYPVEVPSLCGGAGPLPLAGCPFVV